MNVTLYQLTPTDEDITLNWETDFFVAGNPAPPTGYVALKPNDLPSPGPGGVPTAPGPTAISGIPSNFIAGRQKNFQATIPDLSTNPAPAPLKPLTTYYCVAVCDNLVSNVLLTVTYPDNTNTVHLHHPQAHPPDIKANGGKSILSVKVRSKHKPVPNVPVLFTAPANSGQLGPVGGPPQGLSFQVNADVHGKAKCEFTAGNAVGDFTIQITSPQYVANGQSVVVSIR